MRLSRKLVLIFAFLSLAHTLMGCNTLGGPPTPKAICDATIGPIRYNTAKLSSPRHAGPILALDLKAHNQVGQSLGCPNY